MTTLLGQQVGGSGILLMIILVAVGYALGLSVIVGAIIVKNPQRVITPCQVIACLCCPIATEILALHARGYDFGRLLRLHSSGESSRELFFLAPVGMAAIAGVIRFLRRRAAARREQ